MGATSTLYVSRKAALLALAEQLFGGFSDEQLAVALDNRFANEGLREFRVGYDCGQGGADDEELERLY